MLLVFLFSIKKKHTHSIGYLGPSAGKHWQAHRSPFYLGLSSSMCAGGVGRDDTDSPLSLPSTQGCLHYLHLLHLRLRLHQQQLPCFLRAQRCLHSSCPRLWMVWAAGPYSAPSRISKRELWGKPKPVIIVLLRSAKASCLHLEGKVLCFFLPPPAPEVLSFWMNEPGQPLAVLQMLIQEASQEGNIQVE